MKLLILKYGNEYILGMGDVIDCLSLICQIAKEYPNELIIFPCFAQYQQNIQSFLPVGINVKLEPIRDIANHIPELITRYDTILLQNSDKYIKKNKLTGFTDIKGLYHLAGFDYEKRDEFCPISLRTWRYKGYVDSPSPNIAFIPEGGSRHFNGGEPYKIDRKFVKGNLRQVVPPQNTMMLQWVNTIEYAEEIHCHVTSWWRFIDKLRPHGKLFMHHYAREAGFKPEQFEFRLQWEQIT